MPGRPASQPIGSPLHSPGASGLSDAPRVGGPRYPRLLPTLPLALLVPLSLLLVDHLGVYQAGLCWLACWVFQQMFQLDALTRGSFYAALAYALLSICVGYFHCACALSFYILFEVSLLPTLFIVLLYGYQPEKLRAGQYLLLYTVLASLPLLLSLLTISHYLA